MEVRGATARDVTDAVGYANVVGLYGIEAADVRETGKRRITVTCTLRPVLPDAPGVKRWSKGIAGYACWHAHRDVLDGLFRAHPDLVVRNRVITYRGRENYLSTFPATGDRLAGWDNGRPVTWRDACTCDSTHESE